MTLSMFMAMVMFMLMVLHINIFKRDVDAVHDFANISMPMLMATLKFNQEMDGFAYSQRRRNDSKSG